jgi:two-component system, NarL family, nitrate/nitrite response regulator NarL
VDNASDRSSRRTTIVVAVGVRLFREGLAQLLSLQPDLEVKGSAADEQVATERARALQPDVILLDTSLPNATSTARQLLLESPAARVLALGIPESDEDVIGFAEAGVAGYITRDASFEDLIATVRGIASGELLCSPRIAAALLRHVASGAVPASSELRRLTTREREILELIDDGACNKDIAARLNIEVSTVKNHVHHILAKVGASGRSQAAARLRPALKRYPSIRRASRI